MLVDHDHAGGAFDGLVMDGASEREVATPHHHDRRVGTFREGNERGMFEPARVAHRVPCVALQRDSQRRARLRKRVEQGGPARRDQSEFLVDVDREPVECVGGRLWSGAQPLPHAGCGLGGEAEHRRQVAGAINGARRRGTSE